MEINRVEVDEKVEIDGVEINLEGGDRRRDKLKGGDIR